jgi:hypothetical protein
MARTGSFGMAPRAQPSLRSTILAIYREQEARRDQNLMEAWQKGGFFTDENGKRHKATDERVLKHWRDRLKGISTEDPLYDTYKNAVLQYEYAIAESKMTVRYAQEKISDSEAAAFYLNWAKRVPRDSEFYRVLQRDAARYMRAAKAKQSANTAASEEEAYKAQQEALERKFQGPGQLSTWIVTMLAQHGNRATEQGPVLGETVIGQTRDIDAGSNLDKIGLPGVDELLGLLSSLYITGRTVEEDPNTGAKRFGAAETNINPGVIFHDGAGDPVTGPQLLAMVREADPSFSGKFDLAYFQGTIAKQKEGVKKAIRVALKTGHAAQAAELSKYLEVVNEKGNQVNAWPVMESYADLKEQEAAIMADNSLLPKAKKAALEANRAAIGALANDKRIQRDDHLVAQLRDEGLGIEGTVTVSEDMIGARNGYAPEQTPRTSEVMDMNAIIGQLDQTIQLTSDPASGYVMTTGTYTKQDLDGDGFPDFKPGPGGSAVGAALITEITALSGASQPVTMLIPNGNGQGVTPMMFVPTPSTFVAFRPDGTKVRIDPSADSFPFIRVPGPNGPVDLFRVVDAKTGKEDWTVDPPGGPNIKRNSTASGVEWDLSGIVPPEDLTGPTGGEFPGIPGVRMDGKKPGAVRGRGQTPGAAKPGTLVIDPEAAIWGSDPVRSAIGHDPNTDSFSPTLAFLKTLPDGEQLITQYSKDDAFLRILRNDASRSAGMTFDPEVNDYVGTPEQDALRSENTLEGTRAIGRAVNRDWKAPVMPSAKDDWSRDPNTGTEFKGARPATRAGKHGIDYGKHLVGLPADELRLRDSDNKLGLMTRYLIPGTNQLAPTPRRQAGPGGSPDIKVATSLVLPGIAGVVRPGDPPSVKPPSATNTDAYRIPGSPQQQSTRIAPSGGKQYRVK